MCWAGIDEAGYGPNLGPLVMTAVIAEGGTQQILRLLMPRSHYPISGTIWRPLWTGPAEILADSGSMTRKLFFKSETAARGSRRLAWP